LIEVESTTENLSTVLARVSLKAGKVIKRVSILAGQLEKISLSLIMIREEEAVIALKIRCIICRLVTSKI
jgi:hypothetical protein